MMIHEKFNSSKLILSSLVFILFFSSFSEARLIINVKVYDTVSTSNVTIVEAVNVLNPFWLNVSDQRYNDTLYVNSLLLNYLTINESDARYLQTETDPVWNSEKGSYLQTETDPVWNSEKSDYYTKDESNSTFYSKSGGLIDGSVYINGNLTIIGAYLNATVTDIYPNGSIIPQIPYLFDLGSVLFPFRDLFVDKIVTDNITTNSLTSGDITANGEMVANGQMTTNGNLTANNQLTANGKLVTNDDLLINI